MLFILAMLAILSAPPAFAADGHTVAENLLGKSLPADFKGRICADLRSSMGVQAASDPEAKANPVTTAAMLDEVSSICRENIDSKFKSAALYVADNAAASDLAALESFLSSAPGATFFEAVRTGYEFVYFRPGQKADAEGAMSRVLARLGEDERGRLQEALTEPVLRALAIVRSAIQQITPNSELSANELSRVRNAGIAAAKRTQAGVPSK